MRMADNSAPQRLAYAINEAAYRAKYGPGWMGHNDVNAIHGYSLVQHFHARLTGRRAQAGWFTSEVSVAKLIKVPAWYALQTAIELELEPGLALECAEYWGFVDGLE